jgi:transcriptional regulator with XRE-family HTH domain
MFMGKSRKSLAEALDLSPQQIEDFENGFGGISAHQLRQLSAELNVPLSFFFDHAPTNEAWPFITTRL